jgi:hypothetical protein
MEASSTLENSLARVSTVRARRDRPTVRTTYQLAATLGPKEGQTAEEVWVAAIKSIVGWIREPYASE